MRSLIPIFSALFLGSTSLLAQTSAPAAVSAPAVETAPAAATAAVTQGHITINRFVLATGITNREPHDAKDTFSVHDGRVFAFADLSCQGHDHVTFHWKHEGKTYTEFKAPVKDSSRWRTYSSVKALAGSWSVSLEDEHGNVLKEVSFNIGHDATQKNASVQPVADKKGTEEKKEGIKEVLSSLEPAKPAHAAQ